MLGFLRINIAAAVLSVFATPAIAQNACDTFEKSLLFDVKHSPSVLIQRSRETRTLYVLAAPWCEPCTRLYQAYQKEQPGYNISIMPISLYSEKHRRQAVDMVANGEKAADRVYASKRGPKDVDLATHNRIVSALTLSLAGIDERLRGYGKTLGSPFVFLLQENGFQSFGAGSRSASEAEELIGWFEEDIATDYGPPDREGLQDVLLNGFEETPIERRTVYAGSNGALLYSLPHQNAPAGSCLKSGTGYDAVAEIEVNGRGYYKVDIEWTGTEEVWGYMRKDELRP